jgi:formamidopyrimidine-DNA glycosylase
MPELPEPHLFARDVQNELVGRTVGGIEVLQPKCLNLPEDEVRAGLLGAKVRDVTAHGEWLQAETTQGWLLLNLGMGGEILLAHRDRLPEKYRLIVDWEEGGCLAISFWWFGYVHFVEDLADHPMVSKLGPDFMSRSLEGFQVLLRGCRGGIVSFLLNQKRIAGIGNVYGRDPFAKAGIHPLRRINALSDEQMEALYHAIQESLQVGIDLGGSHWEQNLYGEHGRWDCSYFLVASGERKPCRCARRR